MDEPFNINDLKLFPLYHGTDLRIVNMDKEKRQAYKIVCMKMAEYLWQIFKPYYDKDVCLSIFKSDLGDDKWLKLCKSTANMSGLNVGSEQYEYNSFHLTTLKWRAEDYAKKAKNFGEIGFNAYSMYDALRILRLKEFSPDNDMEYELDKLANFAEAEDYQPVIFEINNLDLNLIEFGKLGSLKNLIDSLGYDLNRQPLVIRYKGEVELNPADAILLKK